MVQEVIHNMGIQEFRIAWAKHIGNKATDPRQMPPEDYLRTAYIIWAKELFSFTHLRIIYKKGNEKMGHVIIPMPVNEVAFKQNYKEIQAQKLMNSLNG